MDPYNKSWEQNVKKIVYLQELANQFPDSFIDLKKVTKSHVPAVNVPARIEILKLNDVASTSKARLKRGRPIGSKDKNPQKRKGTEKVNMIESDLEKTLDNDKSKNEKCALEKVQDDDNEIIDNETENKKDLEISINYVNTGNLWSRKDINIDEIFSFSIACEITNENDDPERRTVNECQSRHDWKNWKDAIDTELNSLKNRKVFGPIVVIPEGVKPVGYKWVFVRKRNEKNEIVRYKARLVAQGFSQRPGIDYEVTYSPVMDTITFCYLISLSVFNNLDMYLMDVVTAYLYGSLDNDIYMKIPKGLKMLDTSKPREMYAIKLQSSQRHYLHQFSISTYKILECVSFKIFKEHVFG